MTRARVLLVDDDELARMLMQRQLQSSALPLELWHARDLRSARDALDESRFACVVLDLHLPDGVGSQLAEDLLATAAPPVVIIMTAAPAPALVVRLERLGVRDVLDKTSLDSDALRIAVGRALRER